MYLATGAGETDTVVTTVGTAGGKEGGKREESWGGGKDGQGRERVGRREEVREFEERRGEEREERRGEERRGEGTSKKLNECCDSIPWMTVLLKTSANADVTTLAGVQRMCTEVHEQC